MGTLDVMGGEDCRVQVLAGEDLDYPLASEERPQIVLPGPGFVYAPAVEGAQTGIAYLVIEGKAVKTFPVVFGQTIEMQQEEEKSFLQELFEKIR